MTIAVLRHVPAIERDELCKRRVRPDEPACCVIRRRLQKRIDLIFRLKPRNQNVELQLPDDANHPVRANLRIEDLNDALFAQIIQRLAQLLGLRGVTQHNAAQYFRRKVGQAGKAHVVAFGQSIAHAQRAVVWNADDIAGFRAIGNFAILREKQDRRMNRDGLAKSGRRQLHAAFEGKVSDHAGLNATSLEDVLTPAGVARLREEAELAQAGYSEFDLTAFQNGDLTPVYFGSALKEFGVIELINAIAKYAPPPRPQPSSKGDIDPSEKEVTGFIFKVQANMDPQHRDRIAFMRLCSGTFKRGMKLTPSGLGKPVAIHSPILFFAQDREIADSAEPGDIIGIPNHGTLRVGDTLSERNDVRFTGLPNFAPEILRRVVLRDPTKTKQLRKALDDLSEEGVIQVFYPEIGSNWVIGVVGQLQLDVLISRLEAEYKVDAFLEPAPYDTARWLIGSDTALAQFISFNGGNMAKDRDGHPVFMARSSWDVGYQQEKHPDLKFSATKER